MTEEQSSWWSAFTGLTTGVIILAVVTLGLVLYYTGHHDYREAPAHWSETITRLMFAQSR
jgi:hypothetical protein